VAKVRVYELAKEFGVESKAVMAKLTEMGEFVRSASSTIEAPVVRKLREAFPDAGASAPAPAKKAPAKKKAVKKAPPKKAAKKPAKKKAAKPAKKKAAAKKSAKKKGKKRH